MKYLYFFLAIVILSSCASQTKPAFFFSYHSHSNSDSKVAQQLKIQEPESVREFEILKYENDNFRNEFNGQQVAHGELTASSSNSKVDDKRKTQNLSSENFYSAHLEESEQSKKSVTKSQLKKIIKEDDSGKANGDPKKNKFATAGFITAFLSFLWPVAIVSITLSIIGLKSERKSQAIAGIIIALIAGLIGLLLASAFAGV